MSTTWGNSPDPDFHVPHLDIWRPGEPQLPPPAVEVSRKQHQLFMPETEVEAGS